MSYFISYWHLTLPPTYIHLLTCLLQYDLIAGISVGFMVSELHSHPLFIVNMLLLLLTGS